MPEPRLHAVAIALGVAWMLGCAAREQADASGWRGEPTRMFVELEPGSNPELFGVLRSYGVDVWISPDRRLGVRVHDARHFAAVCEVLDALDHDIDLLDLAFVPLDTLDPLLAVQAVERLDLSGARAELEPLRVLTRLRELSLAQTDYDNFSPLAEVDTLARLDLSGARANLTAIGQISGLRELQLTAARTAPRGFDLREGAGLELLALRELGELERLGLSHTKVRDWAALSELSSLRHLDVSYTNFTTLALLREFSRLEQLKLRRTAVAELGPLVGLDALRFVDVRDCELLDAAQVQQLRAARPDLHVED